MIFGLAVDNWESSVAAPHEPGDGQIVLAALNGLPSLPLARIYRFTAVINPDTTGEVILGVFEATGLTGLTLTGVTAAAGYNDVALLVGVRLEIRVCKGTIDELQANIQQRDSFVAYQDFSYLPDGPLPLLMTGQNWFAGAVGQPHMSAAVVSSGAMTLPSSGGIEQAYPTVDLGLGVTPFLVRATFRFGPEGDDTSSVLMVLSDSSPIDWSSSVGLIYFQLDPSGWKFGFFAENALSELASGSYLVPIPKDGLTLAAAGLALMGDTVTVYLPDGTMEIINDARIGAITGRYVTFQLYMPPGSCQPGWVTTGVTSRIVEFVPYTYATTHLLWLLANQLHSQINQLQATVAFLSGAGFTGPVGFNGAAPAGQGPPIGDAVNNIDSVTKLNQLLAYLRLRGDIAS